MQDICLGAGVGIDTQLLILPELRYWIGQFRYFQLNFLANSMSFLTIYFIYFFPHQVSYVYCHYRVTKI